MGLFIVAPLGVMGVRSITNDDSRFVGLTNFISYFSDRTLRESLGNTVILGLVTMVAAVSLAFPYAYAITCSRMPLRKLFLVLAMIPLYAPTMLYGIGLYTLFGNQGLLTTGFFGRMSFHVSLYIHGLTGIIVSEVMAAFPPAVLILVVSLSHRDRRLYDAAASMGAGAWRTFISITLPACKFALISAASIAFVISTTDYGAPEMLAEKTNVLALDIAIKAMGIGQKSDHAMGAVISLVLLIPTVIASAIEMVMRKKQSATLTARSVAMIADREPVRDWILFFYCAVVSGALLVVTAAPVLISFTTSWPYSLYPWTGARHFRGSALTLSNFNFDLIGQATGGGLAAYWNSLMVAGVTAILGTAISFVAAYLIEKTAVFRTLRKFARAMAMIPLGLPGMVLGLAFVLIFAPDKWGVFPNPLSGIYGTFIIIIACNIVHYLGVSFLTASTAVTQLDAEFEQIAASMNVSTWRLFLRVTVPICTPAILEIGMYYFVSAMTTVSAVIFLVSVRTPLASVAIVNLKDTGNLEPAAAMSVMILVSNIAVRAAVEPLQRFFRNRTQGWTR